MDRMRAEKAAGAISAAMLAAAALYCCQGHGTGNSPAAAVLDGGAESDSSVQPDGISGEATAADACGEAEGQEAGSGDATSFAQPVWTPLTLPLPISCGFEMLSNPSEVGPAFTWGACPVAISGCSALQLSPIFEPAGFVIPPKVVAVDTGAAEWVAFFTVNADASGNYGMIARQDGAIALAWRMNSSVACLAGILAVGPDRFAAACVSDTDRPDGGDIGTVTQSVLLGALEPSAKIAVAPAVQDSSRLPADGAFANGLLAVRWTPYPTLHSLNSADGTGDKVFAPFSLSEEWGTPSAFPGQFLFDRYSSAGLSVVTSDGLSYPSEYISEAATGNSTPLFVDPYIVWQKGINYVGDPADITFERTELWASSYDRDPAKLKPAKVADLAQTHIDFSAMGGFGEFASLSAPPGGAGYPRTVNTWRIPDGQHRAITPQIRIDTLAGVTREAIYFAARSWQSYQGETETIYRVELASMPTVP